MYTIGEFSLSKEVEVVPKQWLTKEGQCWWPTLKNSTKLNLAVRSSATPDPTTYKLYPFRVFRHYVSYETARSNLSRALEDSDLSSEAEDNPISRLRARPVPQRTDRNVSSDDDEDVPRSLPPPVMPPPPVPPSFPRSTAISCTPKKSGLKRKGPRRALFTESSQIEPELPDNHHVSVQNERPSHILGLVTDAANSQQHPLVLDTFEEWDHEAGREENTPAVPPVDEPNPKKPKRSESFETWTIRNIELIKLQLKQLQESLDLLVRDRSCAPGPSSQWVQDDFSFLPVTTMQDFEKLCELVGNKESRQQLVAKLSLRSGSTLSSVVRRALQGLLVDRIANYFNWKGSRGKKKGFEQTPLPAIIYESVRKHRKWELADEKDMETIVKEWFRNAGKRIKGTSNNNNTADEQQIVDEQNKQNEETDQQDA